MDHLSKRGASWVYRRPVPAGVKSLDKRTLVKKATGIRVLDHPKGVRAAAVAEAINAETEAFWRHLEMGESREALARYEVAVVRAQRLGFRPNFADALSARSCRSCASG